MAHLAFIFLFLFTFLHIGNLYAYSENDNSSPTIHHNNHAPIPGHYIERLSVNRLAIGNAGDSVVWDFSNIEIVADTFPQHYVTRENGYRCKEIDKTSLFHVNNDSTLLCAYRSRLDNVVFDLPQLTMTYPLSYGDSASAPFSAKGKYCGIYDIRINGIRKIKADACGKIILAEDITLDNVLRVHSTTTKNILLDGRDLNGKNEAESKQEISEEYFWYIENCRYPIFEYTISSSFHEGKLIATKNHALCNLPDSLFEQLDILNDSIGASKESLNTKDVPPIEYKLAQDGNIIKILYTSSADVDIMFIIANTNGILCQQQHCKATLGQSTEVTFNCTGYSPGSYIMYINVGGKVLSETFYIK